jgi:hypothetical protein
MAEEIIPLSQLVVEMKKFDGQLVVCQGEIIGPVMKRGSFAWLNILDRSTAIGVWTFSSLLPKIKFTGNYTQRGDRIKVIGTFHLACLEHGGELDIHAEKIILVKRGEKITLPLKKEKITLTFFLFFFAFLSVGLYLFRKYKTVK